MAYGICGHGGLLRVTHDELIDEPSTIARHRVITSEPILQLSQQFQFPWGGYVERQEMVNKYCMKAFHNASRVIKCALIV